MLTIKDPEGIGSTPAFAEELKILATSKEGNSLLRSIFFIGTDLI
jgi:hypothetical protein